MMMKMILIVCCWSAVAFAASEHPQLKAFPEAGEGERRHVIVLPEMENEQDYKVELLVGRMMMTDGVNRMGMGGKISRKTVQGWGYGYYQAKLGGVMSTLMAPMPGTPQVERFVHLPGTLIRYNSKLPVVVYTPEDATVRYRIWSAGEMKSID